MTERGEICLWLLALALFLLALAALGGSQYR